VKQTNICFRYWFYIYERWMIHGKREKLRGCVSRFSSLGFNVHFAQGRNCRRRRRHRWRYAKKGTWNYWYFLSERTNLMSCLTRGKNDKTGPW